MSKYQIAISVLLQLLAVGAAMAQTPVNVGDQPYPTEVFIEVDVEPQFPGGTTAWQAWWQEQSNVEVTFDVCEQGYVAYSFVVAADGTIAHPKVVWDKTGKWGARVLEILDKSPLWEPGAKKDQPVATLLRQEVCFRE